MQDYKILVLNITYEPIGITNAKSVLKKVLSGNNLTIERYYPYTYRTAGNSVIQIPAVVRTHRYISIKSFNRKSCSKSDIYERDGYLCVYCGIKPSILTVDHVVPKSRGGLSTFDNLVTSCSSCNNKKGDRTPEEARLSFVRKIPSSYNPIIALINKCGDSNEYWRDYLYS